MDNTENNKFENFEEPAFLEEQENVKELETLDGSADTSEEELDNEATEESTVSSCTINLYGGNITAIAGIEAEDIGAGKIGRATINDYRNSQGSILSDGSLWIILAVAVVAVAGVVTLVIVKKKKKPAEN